MLPTHDVSQLVDEIELDDALGQVIIDNLKNLSSKEAAVVILAARREGAGKFFESFGVLMFQSLVGTDFSQQELVEAASGKIDLAERLAESWDKHGMDKMVDNPEPALESVKPIEVQKDLIDLMKEAEALWRGQGTPWPRGLVEKAIKEAFSRGEVEYLVRHAMLTEEDMTTVVRRFQKYYGEGILMAHSLANSHLPLAKIGQILDGGPLNNLALAALSFRADLTDELLERLLTLFYAKQKRAWIPELRRIFENYSKRLTPEQWRLALQKDLLGSRSELAGESWVPAFIFAELDIYDDPYIQIALIDNPCVPLEIKEKTALNNPKLEARLLKYKIAQGNDLSKAEVKTGLLSTYRSVRTEVINHVGQPKNSARKI